MNTSHAGSRYRADAAVSAARADTCMAVKVESAREPPGLRCALDSHWQLPKVYRLGIPCDALCFPIAASQSPGIHSPGMLGIGSGFAQTTYRLDASL